jgi:ParB-like chromosome segregation protein Spo0J
MSPVHIDELNPETRARVLKEIEEIEGGTWIVSPAVSKSNENAKARQDAFDTSMAYAKSIKTATQPNIPLPKIVPSLVALLVPVTNLKAHPLSIKVYGAPTASEELSRSVREVGVIQPIVIDEDNFILAGTSRHYAATQAGQSEIPAVLFKGSAIEREWLVLESNRQRVKLASQIGREYLERFRLEGEFAKLRQQAGVPLQMAEGGDSREKAAKAVNLGRTTAERLAKIVVKADEGQPKAKKILAAVDSGELSITAAFHDLEPRKPQAKPADCPVCSERFPTMTSLKKHAHHVHGLEATQLRKAMGFEDGEKDPRHNQKSPYADKSEMVEARRSVNSLGWTSALEAIQQLTDIADGSHCLLMRINSVMYFVQGTPRHGNDGNSYHFQSQREWDAVDRLISTLGKTVGVLVQKKEELEKARNACRQKFLEPSQEPPTALEPEAVEAGV